jgi:energy-coupling factor transporter ATP-binding protein EcfA2
LAFLWAVNDIIGSNIILLDECFNNLHPEVNTKILTYIANSPLFEGKQIIIISHEAIHGVFDKIIHLSEVIEV